MRTGRVVFLVFVLLMAVAMVVSLGMAGLAAAP